MVAIGNETVGSETPRASQKETHLISASTTRIGASTAPEAHTSDMPLVRKSLEGRGLSESATSLILQSWRKGTKQQYKPFITKWEQYCRQRKINPFSATIEHGIFWQNFTKQGLDIVPSIQHDVLYPVFVLHQGITLLDSIP